MNEVLVGYVTIIIGLILLALLISFVYIWLYVAKKQKVSDYIGRVRSKNQQKKTLKERLWKPVLKASDYVGPTAEKYPFFVNIEKEKQYLIWAGNPMGISLQQLQGMRYVLGFGSLIAFWLYFMLGLPFGLFLVLLAPIAGFAFPSLWIRYQAKERQETISATMPDFLDIVSISLKAGASLDGALQQVAEKMEGPLSEEISRFNREVSLGVQRKVAFERLLERNYAKELEGLVLALIQGDQLGVSISTTFQTQADDLRKMRGYIAKEKASKASPKITLVTTFVVAPSVFFLIVGLLILNVIYNPGAFGLDIFFN